MRRAKVPAKVVYQKVLESLCERMDPETNWVRPSWLTMMRKIHVCRQRLAEAVRRLKDEGVIKVVVVPNKVLGGDATDRLYEINLDDDISVT